MHVDKERVGLRSKPFCQDLFTFEGLQFLGFVNKNFIARSSFDCSGRGINGEGIIQLAYSFYGCAVKWGKLSKLPKAVLYSELKKSVQAVFPEMIVPDPLDIVFKYWINTCW